MELARPKQLQCQDKATHLINLVSQQQISLSHRRGQTTNWFNGRMLWLQSIMLFHDGMPPAAVGTENRKVNSSTKLCGLPPTTEAFEQNVYRAHFQVAQWHSALSGNPPPLNAVDCRWEAVETNKCRIPRNMAEGVPYAPEQILKLVKCSCASE